MSFEILYDKQFIKVDDERVIPMIQQGSNNCYEASNRKRARDWGNSRAFSNNGNIILTNEEILKSIDEYRDKCKLASEDYEDKRFGYFSSIAMYGKATRSTTFNQFKAFYQTGIKQALTIEELKKFNILFEITVYRWKDEDITSKGFDIKPNVTFESTEHMLKTIEEFETYYQGKFSVYVRPINEWNFDDIKKARKKLWVPKEKVLKTVNEYYVLQCEKGYFIKSLKYGYKYAPYKENSLVKKFETEKQATKYNDKIRDKDKFKVVKIEGEWKFFVNKFGG